MSEPTPDLKRVRAACRVIEAALRPLLLGKFSALYIDLNAHTINYCTVKEACGGKWNLIDSEEWVSAEERAAAIAADRAWSLNWYPDTPIASLKCCASTLEAVVVDAIEANRSNDKPGQEESSQ